MCDDCTDTAWDHYYTLLEKVSQVVEKWTDGTLDNGFAMELIRKIVREENV